MFCTGKCPGKSEGAQIRSRLSHQSLLRTRRRAYGLIDRVRSRCASIPRIFARGDVGRLWRRSGEEKMEEETREGGRKRGSSAPGGTL